MTLKKEKRIKFLMDESSNSNELLIKYEIIDENFEEYEFYSFEEVV